VTATQFYSAIIFIIYTLLIIISEACKLFINLFLILLQLKSLLNYSY